MSIGPQGENLIFLISQPRAGSTLLQRILGSHPDIQTVAEPWLMLHPLYALRDDGYNAEYAADLSRQGVQDFLKTLPDGEDAYVEGLRRMYTFLYDQALAVSGKRYFLDKTPRYFFIIPELSRTFPQARFIILFRNPLAVLSSILKTWVDEAWFLLHVFKHDLVHAPRLLLEGTSFLGNANITIHYERVVKKPENEIRRVCSFLDIDYMPEMIDYETQGFLRPRFGDQKTVYQHSRPVSQYASKWIDALHDPQIWRLTSDYLSLLGPETIKSMGYFSYELENTLDDCRPRLLQQLATFSLNWLLAKCVEDRSWYEKRVLRLMRSLQLRGPLGTTAYVMWRSISVLSKGQ